MKTNVEQFSYHVIWSEEDQEYVGLCDEFPSLSWLDESSELALNGIRRLVSEITEDMEGQLPATN